MVRFFRTATGRGILLFGMFWLAIAQAWSDSVSVEDAYVRIPIPGQENSVAFLRLHNGSKTDKTLVAAQVQFVREVEIHTHEHSDGMMRMRRVDNVRVGAGETVIFEPGGLHLMLFGVDAKALQIGAEVAIVLQFADASELAFKAQVRGFGRGHHH